VLLYVGITQRGAQRLTEHGRVQEWWRAVVRAELEHHNTRLEALVREDALIRSERPRYNRIVGRRSAVEAPVPACAEPGAVPKLSRLREIREQRILSLADLAAKAGVARRTIIRLEKHEVTAQPRTVHKLAAALGVEPAELISAE
jgi:DNA-binding XRE family transcriptional regulator/predicted GIY-YIG superfamily endonuclease